MPYTITEERTFTIQSEDGWYYKFVYDDEYAQLKVSYYEMRDSRSTKIGETFTIPADCIQHFINVFQKYAP